MAEELPENEGVPKTARVLSLRIPEQHKHWLQIIAAEAFTDAWHEKDAAAEALLRALTGTVGEA